MQEFELIAKTFQGLEEVLAQELTELGANNVQLGRRMVSFTGDRLNLLRSYSLCSPFGHSRPCGVLYLDIQSALIVSL